MWQALSVSQRCSGAGTKEAGACRAMRWEMHADWCGAASRLQAIPLLAYKRFAGTAGLLVGCALCCRAACAAGSAPAHWRPASTPKTRPPAACACRVWRPDRLRVLCWHKHCTVSGTPAPCVHIIVAHAAVIIKQKDTPGPRAFGWCPTQLVSSAAIRAGGCGRRGAAQRRLHHRVGNAVRQPGAGSGCPCAQTCAPVGGAGDGAAVDDHDGVAGRQVARQRAAGREAPVSAAQQPGVKAPGLHELMHASVAHRDQRMALSKMCKPLGMLTRDS